MTVTARIRDYLSAQGCTCTSGIFDRSLSDEEYSIPEGAECVIVPGGDGTMIRVADLLAGSVPLVGVNLGTLGFLEEIEVDRLDEMLGRLIRDDFEIEKRMMLSGIVDTEGSQRLHALNDIVIARNGSLRVLQFEIYVNDMLLGTYTADGMIVSTPTGSTAYNLSAGGPIVEPDAQAILLTPICPHNLNSRAIVLSADDVVGIRISEGRYSDVSYAAASFDGYKEIELKKGQTVTIRKASIDTRLIKLNRESFLKTLSRKMIEGRT